MKYIIGIIILLVLVEFGLLIFNRPLFCKFAMLGQINSVPAICLQDALKDLKSNN